MALKVQFSFPLMKKDRSDRRESFYNVLTRTEVLSYLFVGISFYFFFLSQKVIISGGFFFITLFIAIGTGKSRIW